MPDPPIVNGTQRFYADGLPAAVGGIPKKHIAAFLDVCERLNCCILIRSVNPTATDLILAGYPTKPLAVKAKSSDWGPHAGFIPAEPALAKAPSWPAVEGAVAEGRARVQEALGQRLQLAPLVLPRWRLDQLDTQKIIVRHRIQPVGDAPSPGYVVNAHARHTDKNPNAQDYRNRVRFLAFDTDWLLAPYATCTFGVSIQQRITEQVERLRARARDERCFAVMIALPALIEERKQLGLDESAGGLTINQDTLQDWQFRYSDSENPSHAYTQNLAEYFNAGLVFDTEKKFQYITAYRLLHMTPVEVVATKPDRAVPALYLNPQQRPRPPAGIIPFTADYDVFAACPTFSEELKGALVKAARLFTSQHPNPDTSSEEGSFRARYVILKSATSRGEGEATLLEREMGEHTAFQREVALALNAAATNQWRDSPEDVVHHGAEQHNSFHPQPVSGEVVALFPTTEDPALPVPFLRLGETAPPQPRCWLAVNRAGLEFTLCSVRRRGYYYKQNWVHVLSENRRWQLDPFGLNNLLTAIPQSATDEAVERQALLIREKLRGLMPEGDPFPDATTLARELARLMPVENENWSRAVQNVLYHLELASLVKAFDKVNIEYIGKRPATAQLVTDTNPRAGEVAESSGSPGGPSAAESPAAGQPHTNPRERKFAERQGSTVERPGALHTSAARRSGSPDEPSLSPKPPVAPRSGSPAERPGASPPPTAPRSGSPGGPSAAESPAAGQPHTNPRERKFAERQGSTAERPVASPTSAARRSGSPDEPSLSPHRPDAKPPGSPGGRPMPRDPVAAKTPEAKPQGSGDVSKPKTSPSRSRPSSPKPK